MYQQKTYLEQVKFEIEKETRFGESVYVVGDIPELGSGDPKKALKLSPHNYPRWKISLMLPAGTVVSYRFLLRNDAADRMDYNGNGEFLDNAPNSLRIPGNDAPLRSGRFYYLSDAKLPILEIKMGAEIRQINFRYENEGRTSEEVLWRADLVGLPYYSDWEFRIDLGNGNYDTPESSEYYITSLSSLWLQDGEIFNYRPVPLISPSRIEMIRKFKGSLSERDIYVYLPRGYNDNKERHYPVLLMHDGQNIFRRLNDSFAGEWNADITADLLISQGRMRECIIVGISNGQDERVAEYLPPYSEFKGIKGRADKTAVFYFDEVLPMIRNRYRILDGRDNVATCGSSMGGVLSAYLAWEFSDKARHHGVVSPAFFVTKNSDGSVEQIERMRCGEAPDVRLWLDSGTMSTIDQGEDGMHLTYAARDALLENGWALGPDFQHFVDVGALHNEPSWAGRLDRIFLFLFPVEVNFVEKVD